MSRIVTTLTLPGEQGIEHGQRDNGKTFVLTEMDAYAGQRWATKALQAMGAGGLYVDPERLNGGWAALATYAATALLRANTDQLQGLMDELLTCAKYQHDPAQKAQAIVPGIKCPVEEIKTFYLLYRALFELHTGFTLLASTPT